MKRLIWTLLGAAVTIVALLAGLVWYATDAEVLSEQLASALERSTGRPVTIGGPAQLSFGARPTLRLSNVRVGVAQPLLVAGEVAVTLNPIALIQGQVHITKIDASGIRLNLDDAQAIGTQPSTPDLSLRIDEVHLENTEVLAGSATPWRVSNLDLHFDDAQHARFDVSMAPAGSAQSMQSTGSLRLESGLSGPAHIAARGSAFDAVTFRLEGGIQSLLNLSGLNAIVEMEGDLYKTNIKLASRVTGDNRTVQLSNIQGSVEGHKVTGMLRLHPRSTPFKVTGDLQLSALNLGSLGGGRARPTIPSNITADVRISTPKLSVHDRDFAPVSGHVRLHNSQLKIGRIRAGIAGGELTGAASLSDAGTVSLRMKADNLDVAKLDKDNALDGQLAGKLGGALTVTTSGSNSDEWANNAAGTVRAHLDDGRVRAEHLELVVGGVHSLLDMLVEPRSPWVELNCAVADFELASGIATSRLLVADSARATVVGEGNVYVKDKRLGLLVTPRPKSATLNLAVPVRVTGTWDNPSFAPDEGATVRRVGGLVAGALVFPPAIIAAFADLGFEDSGCLGGKILEQADEGKALLKSAEETLDSAARMAKQAGSIALRKAGTAAEQAEQLAKEASVEAETIGTEVAVEAQKAAEEVMNAAEKAAKDAARSLGKLFGN